MNAAAMAIRQFFVGDTAGITAFLGAISLIGTITMALIQAVKDATPMRDRYQRARLREWLEEGATDAEKIVAALPATTWSEALPVPVLNVDAAEADLTKLAVDGDRKALYDLPIEQLCGQLNTALQMVIDYPRKHPALLLIVASCADTGDLAVILANDSAQVAATPAGSGTRITFADARNRVAHQLQRAVDGFQIATSYRWKWLLQIASFVISALFAFVALGIGSAGDFFRVLLTAVLAGFLAPVARDLTAALQKLRAG